METKPVIDLGLVREFIRKAHGDLDRVKELLKQEPSLVNATWDWCGGDFETALGAAAHMAGRIWPIFFSTMAPVSTCSPRRCLASWRL